MHVKEFHQMAAILLAILKTISPCKPNLEFVDENDACMKFEDICEKEESYQMEAIMMAIFKNHELQKAQLHTHPRQ